MSKNISRRDLLKAIIAGSGGFVATSFLPEKWLKPVVKSGVLPVHAQASAPTPGPTSVPTSSPTSTPDQNYVKGFADIDIYNDEGDSYVYALVSSTPFSQDSVKANGKLELPPSHQKKIEYNPVEGQEVSLYFKPEVSINGEDFLPFDYQFVSKKISDSDGYVRWDLEEIFSEDQVKGITIKLSYWFKFEIYQNRYEEKFVWDEWEFNF
jgi:hypothetical protein